MVYVLLAEGFEEIEAVYPIDVLRRCGVEVKTVGVTWCYVTGSNRIKFQVDIGIEDIDPDEPIKMLILPGGPGRINLRDNDFSRNLIKRCYDNNFPIAAICGAPEILGELGCLKGRKATCYPGLESKLKGAQYVDEEVVVDGNLITAKAAGSSEAFAFAIAEFLCGKDKTNEVRGKMLCGL